MSEGGGGGEEERDKEKRGIEGGRERGSDIEREKGVKRRQLGTEGDEKREIQRERQT